jgi:hypothetical protein
LPARNKASRGNLLELDAGRIEDAIDLLDSSKADREFRIDDWIDDQAGAERELLQLPL